MAGLRCARSDTPRTPLLYSHWRIIWRIGLFSSDWNLLECSASCSRRIRRASMPPGQSFARRPCLAISVHSSLDLRQRPSRFQPRTLPTELVCINGQSTSSGGRILLRHCDGIVPSLLGSNIFDNETANPLQPDSIGTFNDIPPDLKRCYFGHVTCPAVSESFEMNPATSSKLRLPINASQSFPSESLNHIG